MKTEPLSPPAPAAKEDIDASLRLQILACKQMGSPLNAYLIELVADDFQNGGITAEIFDGWRGDPLRGFIATRFIGGPHFAVIQGKAEALADYYPSVGGTWRREGFKEALFEALEANIELIKNFIQHPPQTNEVNRSGVLLGGFFMIAARTGLPLRMLEVGASAGLNLNWHKFAYNLGVASWGNADSPVQVETTWSGDAPGTGAPMRVVETRGCDIAPLDITEPGVRARMRAYVWADQPHRYRLLEAGINLALHEGTKVEKSDAATWIRQALDVLPDNAATVIYHSIVRQYFDRETNAAFCAAIEDAGARATRSAPVAWLQMENAEMRAEGPVHHLSLTLWPGGEKLYLGYCHPHGFWVKWHAP